MHAKRMKSLSFIIPQQANKPFVAPAAQAGLRDINTPESELASKQIAQTVNDAIAALPEELRTAITLRELDGLSYEEIAQIMNCPIGTVRSRIFRAREAVAEQLRPQLGT